MTANRGRGYHAGLDAGTILETAVELADREGLAALSMRGLGAELGVEAMALYHHFPSKNALLDGVVEQLTTEVPVPRFDDTDWMARLRDYARAQLDTLTAHPNLVSLLLSRPAVREGNLRRQEMLVESLTAVGFDSCGALDLVFALNGLVAVNAAVSVGVGDAPAPHGEVGQNSRLTALSAETYPFLVEAASASSNRGPRARFEAALTALLTGFAEARGEAGGRQT